MQSHIITIANSNIPNRPSTIGKDFDDWISILARENGANTSLKQPSEVIRAVPKPQLCSDVFIDILPSGLDHVSLIIDVNIFMNHHEEKRLLCRYGLNKLLGPGQDLTSLWICMPKLCAGIRDPLCFPGDHALMNTRPV